MFCFYSSKFEKLEISVSENVIAMETLRSKNKTFTHDQNVFHDIYFFEKSLDFGDIFLNTSESYKRSTSACSDLLVYISNAKFAYNV